MKPIKIVRENKELIEDALLKVNGRCHEHAFTLYCEIEQIAQRADSLAFNLLKNKK